MTDIHKLFCVNLSKKRQERELSQEAMAEKLKINTRSYQKIEYGWKYGTHFPTPIRMRQLARILKCDTVDFFKP